MAKTDPRIDAYIAESKPFAQPILKELRARIHAAVPGLSETIKWGAPFFLLNERIFASMAGFKAHTKLLLWNADFKSAYAETTDFASLEELPSKPALAKQLKASAATFKAPPAKKKAAAKKPAAKKAPKKK